MIRFHLLCHRKEVESIEYQMQSSNIINITLRRQVNHSDNLSLGPTAILQLLGHNHSHAMGKGVTRKPKSLSQACLPVTVDQNY